MLGANFRALSHHFRLFRKSFFSIEAAGRVACLRTSNSVRLKSQGLRGLFGGPNLLPLRFFHCTRVFTGTSPKGKGLVARYILPL